jgi:hypothetical protein
LCHGFVDTPLWSKPAPGFDKPFFTIYIFQKVIIILK